MRRYVSSLIILLVTSWLSSGERFLDWVFDAPAFPGSEAVLGFLVDLEDAKATLGLPDLFGILRTFMHDVTGLE